MRDFSRDRRSGGGRDFKRRDFDRPQVMHKTICSNCGKECEVPFKPNGSKPVFCRECFQNNRTSEPVRSENFPRRSNFEDRGNNQVSRPVAEPQYREQFESLNAKLDKILNLLAVKEVAVSKPIQVAEMEIPEVETPVVKKKRVTKKKV
jgi:CxxC-x17-CxxC domain-containing protein